MSEGHKPFGAAAKFADPELETSQLTKHLSEEWKETNKALETLAAREDKLITEGQEIPEALEAEIDEAYGLLRKIVLDALSIRSESLDDICVKLEIWQSHTFSDKVKPHLLQPSDLLIRQTIREIAEYRKMA